MIINNFNKRNILVFLVVTLLVIFLAVDFLEAREGSFGGRRSSGRTYSRTPRSRTLPPSSSFGNKRSQASRAMTRNKTSFGGTKMNTAKEYTSKYGVPRKMISSKSLKGMPSNYRIMDYGGYGSGLLTGYVMGRSSLMWSLPFHPAFYYTRPYYVTNPDGTVSVYPPTFSISKVIFTIIMFAAVVFVVYRVIKKKRVVRRQVYYSAQKSIGSKSSFD